MSEVDPRAAAGFGPPSGTAIPRDKLEKIKELAFARPEGFDLRNGSILAIIDEVERLTERVAEVEASAEMACENPPEDCECHGCMIAAETGGLGHYERPGGTSTCECAEPDGPCDGCGEAHGHTCIICGVEYCTPCWETQAHNATCKREVMPDGSIRDARGDQAESSALDEEPDGV